MNFVNDINNPMLLRYLNNFGINTIKIGHQWLSMNSNLSMPHKNVYEY